MRCDHCTAEAMVVSPGIEAPRVLDLFMEVRGAPMRCWCLACAMAAGFPWLASETPRADKRNAGGWASGASREQCDDQDRKTPAADSRHLGAGRQGGDYPQVGRGASRRGRRLAPAPGAAA
jgi:hypothetical protein